MSITSAPGGLKSGAPGRSVRDELLSDELELSDESDPSELDEMLELESDEEGEVEDESVELEDEVVELELGLAEELLELLEFELEELQSSHVLNTVYVTSGASCSAAPAR